MVVSSAVIDDAGWRETAAGVAVDRLECSGALSAHEVAETAIDGLDKGKGVIIPGVGNRVGAYVAHVTPRRVLLPLLARQHPALKT